MIARFEVIYKAILLCYAPPYIRGGALYSAAVRLSICSFVCLSICLSFCLSHGGSVDWVS